MTTTRTVTTAASSTVGEEADVRGALNTLINDTPRLTGPAAGLVGLLRLAIGWLFTWGFVDKIFGLGFDTCRAEDGTIDVMCDSAFLSGGSSTWGFLTFGTAGSKTGDWFSWLASSGPGSIGIADILYLGALLITGVTFMTGIALRLGAFTGAGLMISIYLASSVWPQFNPFLNENLVYALVMVVLAAIGAGRYLGLADSWKSSSLGQRYSFLG